MTSLGKQRRGYRQAPAPCPACDTLMEERDLVTGATIDACPSCGGVWVDWMDGPIEGVAAAERERAEAASGPRGEGSGRCPRCERPLADETFAPDAPKLRRCGECIGVFVPAAALDRVAEGRPTEGDDVSWWTRLSARLQAWLD